MTPHEEKIPRLRQLAEEARNYQLEREWSDGKICTEIAFLGSTKTYKRILDPADDLSELNIDKQLASYENALELIKSKRAMDLPPEPEYDDFINIVNVRRAVAAAMNEETIARFVCVEGENGTGKDAAIRSLRRTFSKVVVDVEASEFWRDSLAVPLADMINAMSIRQKREEGQQEFHMPNFPFQRLELLEKELGKKKVLMAVNEVHHMGPRGLNLFKGLINKTPVVPVFFCIPVLLNRLIKSGYEEAAQLFGNRLCRRVRLEPPGACEILLLLERRGVKLPGVAISNAFAREIEKDAPSYGNWRFVGKVARKAIQAGQVGREIAHAKLSECMVAARNECVSQQRMKQ